MVLLVVCWIGNALARAGRGRGSNRRHLLRTGSNPAKFNHKVIRVEGLVSHGFEDFQISNPECPRFGFSVWLTYGDKLLSNTMYCCAGEGASSNRSEPLQIDSITLSLRQDGQFKTFYSLLKESQDTTAKATLVGHFFAGAETRREGPTTPLEDCVV